MWDLYLAYSQAGFLAGYRDVHQLLLQRPADRQAWLTAGLAGRSLAARGSGQENGLGQAEAIRRWRYTMGPAVTGQRLPAR